MVQIVRTLSGLLNPDILVENVILFSVLSIFLAMYGPRLHIRLPSTLRGLFDSALFRGVILFLIAYMSHRDFIGALVVSIIFLVTINLLQGVNVIDQISEIIPNLSMPKTSSAEEEAVEKFSPNGPPVANCNTYTTDAGKVGTMYYPLNDNTNVQEMRGGNQGAENLNGTFDQY